MAHKQTDRQTHDDSIICIVTILLPFVVNKAYHYTALELLRAVITECHISMERMEGELGLQPVYG